MNTKWEELLRKGDIFAIPVGDNLTAIKNLHPLEMDILVKFIKDQITEAEKFGYEMGMKDTANKFNKASSDILRELQD